MDIYSQELDSPVGQSRALRRSYNNNYNDERNFILNIACIYLYIIMDNECLNYHYLNSLYDIMAGYFNPQSYYETSERYDIEDVKEALIELKKLDFNILSNKDKYKLYIKLIKLYKYFSNDLEFYNINNTPGRRVAQTRGPQLGALTGLNEEEIFYYRIIINIINNIKYFFSLLQTTKLEDIIIELMKPKRVLNRLTTYDNYEYN